MAYGTSTNFTKKTYMSLQYLYVENSDIKF